jgi:hypothetical protein
MTKTFTTYTTWDQMIFGTDTALKTRYEARKDAKFKRLMAKKERTDAEGVATFARIFFKTV